MRSKAVESLGYTGVVTLSQYIGNKKVKLAKIHNEGKKPLFNFLTSCLAGDFALAEADRPTKIMLLTKKDDNTYESASTFYHLYSAPEKVYLDRSYASTIRYSFILARAQIESADFNCIGLYAKSTSINDCGDMAAVCDVDISKLNLSNSSVLVVDWELSFTNESTELVKNE